MNVAILMPMGTQRGGGELMLRELLAHTQDTNISWTVIFFEDGPLVSEFQALNADTFIIPTGRLRHVHRYVWSIQRIADLIRSESIDLVISWSGKPHLYGSPAALLAGVPAAWYQLGCPRGRHLSWMDRLATVLPAQCIFTLSEFGSAGQENLWPYRPTRLVYPSATLSKFDPDQLPSPVEARRQLNLPEEGPLIGIVGRLQRWKGIHVFIEAMPYVLEAYPDAHGVIVGGKHDLEPDYPDLLTDLIVKHKLGDHITVAGFQENIPLWMQAMDVVVHASDHEPFGIVIIEAMALGKPVIAGAEGGPKEIITHNQHGLLAPYGDDETLADGILRYLDDPDFARDVGQAARERAHDFSPEAYAERFTETLYDVVPSTHRSRVSS